MRICQIMGGDEDGGLETHFAHLANALAALGDDVSAIAHPRYRAQFDAGVRFHPLDLTRSRRNPLLRLRLRRLLRAIGPEIAHAQGGKAAHLLRAVRPPMRVVGTVHGVKRDLSAYARFDAVIGVSAGVLGTLAHPRKVVVHNGVGPPPPPVSASDLRQRFGIPEGRTVTVAVGRLVPVKGYRRLITLWHAGLGHLLILGDGPQRAELSALAKGKPVTLAGFQADARALMAAADLMVFASEREGFSYAMAEALRARLPIVATPVPGAAELLPEGHLAPPEALAATLARCLADIEGSRARMRELFDWAARALTVERMAAATRRVYADVLASPKPSEP